MEHRGCVGSSRLPHRGSRLVFFVALFVALSATPSLVRAEDEDPAQLRIIARGATHFAEAALDTGRLHGRDLLAEADEHLEAMFARHPGIWRLEDGLQALVVHSKVAYARGRIDRAATIAHYALTRARETDHRHMERLANEQLRRVILGVPDGSTRLRLDPAVLRRIAYDLLLLGRYDDAIRAYRTVIASTPDTAEAFLDQRWHAWERMALSYRRLGDRLGEALAYEPVHEAWMFRRIPRGQPDREDPNFLRAGNNRRRAQFAMRELADRTGSRTFNRRFKEIRDSFLHDYPAHHTGVSSRTWPHHWRSAMQLRKANREGWREEFRTAYRLLVLLSESWRFRDCDRAWVYRIRVRYELAELEEALAEARLAWESWNSAETRARAAKSPSTVAGRHPAQGMALYWEARVLQKLGRTKEAVAALEGWHDAYPELDSPYPELGYDLLVQAHLEAGQIAAAEAAWRALLDAYPTYRRLGTVTFLLADHFNAQRAEVEKPLREVMRNFYDVRGDLRGAKKEVLRLDALLASLDLQLAKAIAMDDYWRRVGSPGDREEVERLEGRIADTTRRRHTWVGKRDDLLEQSEKLRAEKDALDQKLYEPLVKAANIYFAWDQVLKNLEEEAAKAPR